MATRIHVHEHQASVDLQIAGRFNRDGFELLQDALESVEIGERALVLDFQQLDEIDSCGLGMLLLIRQASKRSDVTIRGATGYLRSVLTTANMGQLFQLE